MFLGEDIAAWLVLALGGAMLVGHVVALLNPPGSAAKRRAPLGRSLVFIGVGALSTIWALASLLS